VGRLGVGFLLCFDWTGQFPCFNPPTRMVMKVGPLTFIHGASWRLFTCERHLEKTVDLATLGGTYKVVYEDER
jgi:hypothetical protein